MPGFHAKTSLFFPAGSSPVFRGTWSILTSPTSFKDHWSYTPKPQVCSLWEPNCCTWDSNGLTRWPAYMMMQQGSDEQWREGTPVTTKGGASSLHLSWGKATEGGHREKETPWRNTPCRVMGVITTRLQDSTIGCRGNSILELHKAYYGMFAGISKGREREGWKWISEEQMVGKWRGKGLIGPVVDQETNTLGRITLMQLVTKGLFFISERWAILIGTERQKVPYKTS